jgi:hypothetical protein
MWYYWCSIILSSFPSFPKFHRVVPLLQTCSTTEFVYYHARFYIYVYLRIYLPHVREHMCLLCFWSWLTSLSMISSNCTHLPSDPVFSKEILNRLIFRVKILDKSVAQLKLSSCFTFFLCGTGAWTQGLHLEPLYQPYFCEEFFEIGHELFAWADCEPWSLPSE